MKNKKKFTLILVLALGVVAAIFAVLYFIYLKPTTIGQSTLKGKYETSVVFEDGIEEGSQLVHGQLITYEVTLKHEDSSGMVAIESIETKEIVVELMDETTKENVLVESNTIRVNKDAESNVVLEVNISYKGENKTYKYTVKEYQVSETGGILVDDPNSITVVVNKERHLPADYVPEDLVTPDVRFAQPSLAVRPMREEAGNALELLFSDAEKDGNYLYAMSGYRSYEIQKSLFTNYSLSHGEEAANRFSARPGQSEHQLGLAMDVSCESIGFILDEKFEDTKEGTWVRENAHKYGFIIRYQKGKEDITGYMYEPWHLRYVGVELASEIKEKDVTLEEYFGLD